MSGKKNDKDELKKIANLSAGMLSNSFVNIAVAFGVMFILSWIISFIAGFFYSDGNRPEWIGQLVFAVFLAIIFSDPYEAWKDKKVNYRFFGKFGLGMILGYTLFAFDFGATGDVKDVAGETDGSASLSWMPWMFVLIPLAMMPFLFGTHALDRFEKNKNTPIKARINDAALEYVNTSGPVIMMLVMGVCALFYWIVAMPSTLLIAFLTVLALGMIIYCIFFYDGVEEPIVDEDYTAPRSETFGQAFSQLLDVSTRMLPGMLYITGLIWVAMAFWDFSSIDAGKGEDFNGLLLIWPIIAYSLIGLVVVPGGVVFIGLAYALLLAAWAHHKGMGMTEAKMRADKFNEILYGGAMGKLFHGNLEKHKD